MHFFQFTILLWINNKRPTHTTGIFLTLQICNCNEFKHQIKYTLLEKSAQQGVSYSSYLLNLEFKLKLWLKWFLGSILKTNNIALFLAILSEFPG